MLLARPESEETQPPVTQRWKMPWSVAGIGLVALLGVIVLLYPSTASWFSQYNQSQIVEGLDEAVLADGSESRQHALEQAHSYNDALIGGATGVQLDPSSGLPISHAVSPDSFAYEDILRVNEDGVMARLRIPAIGVDLPIYHGTAEHTLAQGVGHLEGTSLPVGGVSQHAVLTAHRGLPTATLFNDLGEVSVGDTFTVEVFGEVLTYRVTVTQTILPEESQALLPEFGKDLVTLVTCTPLGVNTHRYLVTGERVLPTPVADVAAAGERPDIPGFPWWSVALAGAGMAYAAVVIVAGRSRR